MAFKERLHARRQFHNTKHGLHPALPIFLGFVGTSVVSLVFGMLIFPVFTHICAAELLLAVSKWGYFGVGIIMLAVWLEAYHLYEHHKRHVIWLVILSIVMCLSIAWLIYLVATHYSCIA